MTTSLVSPARLVGIGLRSALIHKLRSFLAILGIVFGVASVVSLLAIGEGASFEVREQLMRLGPDRILLSSVHPPDAMVSRRQYVLDYGLRDADFARVQALVPGVVAVAPTYEIHKTIWVGHRSTGVQLVGTTASFQEIHHLRVARGRFLAPIDLESQANVAVLGAATARKLFGAEDPLGKEFKHSSGHYRIIGILRPRTGATATVYDADRSVFIPLTTAKARLETVIRVVSGNRRSYERVELHQIALRVRTVEQVPQIASMIRRLIEPHHPQRDYELKVPYELLRQTEHTKRVFNIVLGSSGAISLLVGGIGIMNIMLATVMERTREIGIRRSVGATRWHIQLHFLVETVVLSTIGGILGLGLGLIIPGLVTYFSQLKTVVTFSSLALSLLVSLGVGIIAGVYPARKAALMDPIEALRHE